MMIVNHQLETIVPFISRDSAIATLNLEEVLGVNSKKYGLFASENRTDAETWILNMRIWRKCKAESTAKMFYSKDKETDKKDIKYKYPYYTHSHYDTEVIATTNYFDGLYLSEIVRRRVTVTRPQLKGVVSNSSILYNTYRLSDGKLQELTLSDVLASDGEATLDKLIAKELNRLQAFGTVCVDLPGEIEKLKQNFQLSYETLVFYSNGRTPIGIPFSKLEGFIKI